MNGCQQMDRRKPFSCRKIAVQRRQKYAYPRITRRHSSVGQRYLIYPGSFAYLKKAVECPPEIGAIGFNPWLCTYDKHIQHLPSPDAPLHMNDSLRFAPTHYGLFRREVFAKCSFDENFGVGWAARMTIFIGR